MVDIQNLVATPTADDFEFKVGKDIANMVPAPLPQAVEKRDLTGGVKRITIIWADGAIKNTWLKVTVKSTLGISENQVFYVGNVVGECGNSDTDTMVNACDQLGARANAKTDAPITDNYDYNRDKAVNNSDVLVSRGNPTSPVTMLEFIKP